MKKNFAFIRSAWRLTSLLLLINILIPENAHSQDKKTQLQQEKKQIEEDIAYTSKLLAQTSQSRRSTMEGLTILQQNIRQRERLINNIKAELAWLENEIAQTGDSISRLSAELRKLKDEYAKMIYHANRNRNAYERLVFIFSAEDFNQAYRRIRYFQQYATYRRTQAGLIRQASETLAKKELELERSKAEKQNLLGLEQEQKKQLETEKSNMDVTIHDLSKREKELKAALKEKEKAAADMEKAIQAIIAEEIRLAEERARAEAGTKTSSGFALTPEEMLLSENFVSNKGKLPWPTERGIVSGTYGEHQHPVLPRVKIKNNGIDILTSEGEHARAVFSGVVTRVMSVPNFNNVVIIRHGEYLTVYSNLDEVLVQRDQMVETKQPIGRIYTNRKENKTELHFEIWKAKDLMDPAPWLAGKR
jgi:septal ring factor EnvC (AmiA/AmiB activator)